MSTSQATISSSALAWICRPGMRSRFLSALALTAAGACLGGGVGAVVLGGLGADVTARTFVRVVKPHDLAAIAVGARFYTPDLGANVPDYAAGEAAYLGGPGFAFEVRNRLGRPGPVDFSVGHDSGSPLISLSSSAASEAEALKTVRAALDVYRRHLRWQSTTELAGIEAGDAFQDRRDQVRLLAAQGEAVEVVQAPFIESTEGQPRAVGLMLGAVIGGSATALAVVRRRSDVARLTSEDIAGAVDAVLVPTVDLRSADDSDGSYPVARLLYTQIPSTQPHPVIAVVGASRESGAADIASLLISAADETAAVVPVADLLGGPASAATALASATHIVVVVRIDADTVSDVLAVHSATAAAEVPLIAVLTYRSAGRWKVGAR